MAWGGNRGRSSDDSWEWSAPLKDEIQDICPDCKRYRVVKQVDVGGRWCCTDCYQTKYRDDDA